MEKICPAFQLQTFLKRHFITLICGKRYFFSNFLSFSLGEKVTLSNPSVLNLILHLHATLDVSLS